jgi:hypothetical protein
VIIQQDSRDIQTIKYYYLATRNWGKMIF